LAETSKSMDKETARWLVDIYYTVQDYRIRSAGQERASKDAEPHALVSWCFGAFEQMEKNIKRALGLYAKESRLGEWCLSIHGIGPVITAGLLAHIDIERAPTVGHIWSFAGLDPTKSWEKGKKRPWNAKLKTLCAYKIGTSFVRLRGSDNDIYGKVYDTRKEQEIRLNEEGAFAEQAARVLRQKKIQEPRIRAIYESGKLPPGHLDARARRYAVKLFLAHFHHVAYEIHYRARPPKPYILEHGGHVHFIAPPNWTPLV
jgi:hypothetical protein